MSIRSILRLFVLGLFTAALPAMAQAQAQAACSDPAASLLWQVEGGRDDIEVYLFGTIHVGRRDFYPLPAVIEQAFLGADYLVFEVDPRNMANPFVALEVQRRARLPAGQTLADVLSSDVLAELTRTLEDMGTPLEPFMGLQPWFITVMLANLQVEALGYSSILGIENYLLTRKPEQAEILELESIEEQLAFLEELNTPLYLTYTLQNFAEAPQDLERLIQAWQCADKESLSSLLFEGVEEEQLAPVLDTLYFERNITMAGKIGDMLATGRGHYFVAVGSAHLLGDGSIVELLREEGYQVTPLPLTGASQ